MFSSYCKFYQIFEREYYLAVYRIILFSHEFHDKKERDQSNQFDKILIIHYFSLFAKMIWACNSKIEENIKDSEDFLFAKEYIEKLPLESYNGIKNGADNLKKLMKSQFGGDWTIFVVLTDHYFTYSISYCQRSYGIKVNNSRNFTIQGFEWIICQTS